MTGSRITRPHAWQCPSGEPYNRVCRTKRKSKGAVSNMDPSPDYDATDELEYFFSAFPWALRGVYPPPAIPPV